MEYKCKFCEKVYKSIYEKNNRINLKKHILYCELNPDRILYECKYCGIKKDNGSKLGAHISICIKNPNYESILKSKKEKGREGRPHTNETKRKISEKRIEYLKNNPDKVPYLLNHSSKESYPEKYFTNLFNNEDIDVIKYYRIGTYELDFCIIEKKIDIEIDGDQHYLDEKIVKHDIKRNKFLENKGWIIFRIKWSDYKKMSYSDKENYIKELKNKIGSVA
jgi:very-short-patch-repair endonuclease